MAPPEQPQTAPSGGKETTMTTTTLTNPATAVKIIDDLDRRIAAAQSPVEALALNRERLDAIMATGRTPESHGDVGLIWELHAELTRQRIRRLERRLRLESWAAFREDEEAAAADRAEAAEWD